MPNNNIILPSIFTGEPDTDPFIANVVLLMHFDGANNGTNFVDQMGHVITRNGNPLLLTDNPLSGQSSGHFSASTGDWLSLAASVDWAFPGDFTIEGTLRPDVTGSQTIIGCTTGANSWSFALNAASTTPVWWYNGNAWTGNVGTGVPGVPHKFALVRSGSTLTLYYDGVKNGNPATGITGTYGNSTSLLSIGAQSGGSVPFSGYLDEIRITKGVARYLTDYTPRVSPFPNI